MEAKILIVEDDIGGADLIKLHLERSGYEVRIAVDGAEGLQQAYTWQPHLVLLDIMLPIMSGWAVCERLRQISNAAIIFLTVLDQEKHVIQGFELGADDYICKPFSQRELLARIKAVLRRRSRQVRSRRRVYIYNDLENVLQIDLDRRQVVRDDQVVALTPLEFRLLVCLAENVGQNCSHEHLINCVWGDKEPSRNSLKLYIWQLRQKLELDPADPKIILTEHGTGYRLRHPRQPESSANVA